MRSNIIVLMRMALVFVFFIGIIICTFWYPFTITIGTVSLLDYDESAITPQQNVELYTQLIFYWTISLPCFVILIMGFIDTGYTKKYGTFNIKSANILFKMALILSVSSVIFIIGNIIFMLLGWNTPPSFGVGGTEPTITIGFLYCIVGVVGLALSAGLYVAHKYIARRITTA